MFSSGVIATYPSVIRILADCRNGASADGLCRLASIGYHPGMTDPADRTPTDEQQDADRPDVTRQDATVGVVEAAQLLGTTTDAVRARLRRGTLQGHKVDGEWQVIIPAPTVGQQDATEHQQDATADRQDVQQSGDRTPTVDLAPLADLIERQANELADLREAATIWQVRARQAEEQLKVLTAGNVAPETSPEALESPQTNESEPQGFWARVRRLWRGEGAG